MPSVCIGPNDEFTLPHLGNKTGDLLLWALFDMTRYELSHKYQQIIANLIDGKKFFIELSGPDKSRFLARIEIIRHMPSHITWFVMMIL
jgi:hypothetical protein